MAEDGNLVKRAVSSVADMANRASGKELADRVETFTDTFSEVLLGLHQDQQRLARVLDDELAERRRWTESMGERIEQLARLESGLEALRQDVGRQRQDHRRLGRQVLWLWGIIVVISGAVLALVVLA